MDSVKFNKLLIALALLCVTGCATQFCGDVVTGGDVNVFYAVDRTYLRPTPWVAKQLANEASFHCNKKYGIYRDCDDVSSAMAQWIRDRYAENPITGCQTMAVFKLMTVDHQIIVIETTEGDMFFDNDGSIIDAPSFEIGRFQ